MKAYTLSAGETILVSAFTSYDLQNSLTVLLGSWFAWANSVFAQTILDVAERKPHILFGPGEESYIVD
jgi:meiotically up-regulated gene 157 (Mug157) protein